MKSYYITQKGAPNISQVRNPTGVKLKSYRLNQLFRTFRLLSLRLMPSADQKAIGKITDLTDETGHFAIFVCKTDDSNL